MDLYRTSTINLCLEFTYQKKETYLLQKILIRSLVEKCGKHVVYTDGGTRYPQACNFLGLKHMLHSSIEKNLIEREWSILKIEQKILMITIHVSILIVIWYMYTI